jgi:DNA-binding NtrC family response regulator
MPGMTGAELSAAARRLRPDLPVVMITGYAAAAPDDLGRFAVAVLRKPFRIEDLDKRLRRLLAVRRRTQEMVRS